MAEAENRRRIAKFLEQQLFRPVLDDNPDDHAVFRRDGVEEVRRRVAVERDGITGARSYGTMLLAFREACERSKANGLEEHPETQTLPTFESVRGEPDQHETARAITTKPTPASRPVATPGRK